MVSGKGHNRWSLGKYGGADANLPAQWNSGCHDLETLGERVGGGGVKANPMTFRFLINGTVK